MKLFKELKKILVWKWQDDGHCTITAKTQESGQKALNFIKNILKDIEVGDEYEGKIIKILDTVGAIVELGKGKE